MLTMEWKIGEIKQVNGEWYQCVEGTCNNECYFYNRSLHKTIADINGDGFGACNACFRNDNKSVIFKKLEKVGEPFIGKVHIQLQRYKIYAEPIVNPTENIGYIDEGNMIAIEIKENKEDMEEKKLNLKPFDIQKAREGKPICTRDGKKARIVCFDKGGIYPVIALVQEEGSETCHFYAQDGKCADSGNGYDLLMLSEKKEGWANVYDDTPIYDSKEEALNRRSKIRGYIDTVKVSWEE